MELIIPLSVLKKIHSNVEKVYPDEGNGLLLGTMNGDTRFVESVLELINSRDASVRQNRYLITAEDMMKGENEAVRLGLDIIGVFHSHPDHPNKPSEFDREWAMPWFSYLITSVSKGDAQDSRSWRLSENRDGFVEEKI